MKRLRAAGMHIFFLSSCVSPNLTGSVVSAFRADRVHAIQEGAGYLGEEKEVGLLSEKNQHSHHAKKACAGIVHDCPSGWYVPDCNVQLPAYFK